MNANRNSFIFACVLEILLRALPQPTMEKGFER